MIDPYRERERLWRDCLGYAVTLSTLLSAVGAWIVWHQSGAVGGVMLTIVVWILATWVVVPHLTAWYLGVPVDVMLGLTE